MVLKVQTTARKIWEKENTLRIVYIKKYGSLNFVPSIALLMPNLYTDTPFSYPTYVGG